MESLQGLSVRTAPCGCVIGLIYGDKVPEGGVELRRRRGVYRQQLVIDHEAGESPLQMEGLENAREFRVRCSWKRLRSSRHESRISQPELDICACLPPRFPESRSQPNISGNNLLWVRV